MAKTRWFRLLLTCLLVIVVSWFWSTRFDELIYHTVGSTELIELGDAVNFGAKQNEVPLNSYVEVSGILGNKAATLRGLRAGSLRFGRYQVRHLLGSKLYVEFDEEALRDRFTPFTRINIKGRLTSFGPNSELEKVRAFFKDYYNQSVDDKAMLIVMDEAPRSGIVYPIMFAVSILVVIASIWSTIAMFRRRRENDDQDTFV